VSLLCLVPTALRASRLTRRLCDAQGGALFGRQATTFEALSTALVAASGDRRPVLAPIAERLLAVEVGREVGGAFATLSPSDGLAGALGAALGELRRGEVTAAEARAAAGTIDGAARARLERLAAALEGWERRLEERGLLDRAGAVRAAAIAARGRVTVAETESPSVLLLDGFSALAPAEWDLFVAVAARAGAIRVHLPHFADLPAATAAAEPLARRLESLHELAAARAVEVIQDRLDDPARAGRLSALLSAAAGAPPPPPGTAGTVEARCEGGEWAEARALAATAADWVAAGMSPEELRIFSPAPGADAARLARAFAEVGLPLSLGRGPALVEVPVVRLVREALDAAGGLGRRAAERLAGSSYLTLGAPADRLAARLDRAGAVDGRKPPAEALRAREATLGGGASRERAGIGRAARRLEALEALLAPLREFGTARRHAARLAAFLDAGGIRRRAARAEPSIAARDLAALARVQESAEEVARALALLGRGESTLACAEWVELLDTALRGATLPPIGGPFGGAVELLGLDDAPGEAARGVLIAGCGRGTFPCAPPPEPVLREPERQALNALLRRAAVATAGARRAEARHRALCAVAAAREAILFTWQADDGPAAPMVDAGLAAVGRAAPAGPSSPAGLSSARSARERLRALARQAHGAPPRAAVGEALGGRLSSALARGALEAARRAAVDRRAAAPGAGAIAPEEAAPALPAEWTPSQLEEYARCPFRLFLGLGVGLREPEGSGLDIDPSDEGSLLHAALERFVAARVARGAWPPAGDEPDRAEANAVADAIFGAFERAGRTGDPSVWAARRQAVRARLLRWIDAEARDADGLVPRLLEHRFGGTSGRPPLTFGAGAARVDVQGRIDRVDADGRRLMVLDYKNARSSAARKEQLAPESFGVTSFQIPIYLAAAARELPGREELGATLALLRDGERLEPLQLSSAAIAEGPLGARLSAAIVETVARARAGAFPIASRDCEYCELGAVCRFQGTAEAEEGGLESSAP
jgi:hypothetical protein